MTEGTITHFSYSQLNTYLMCPLRYKLQYVELIQPAFTTAALAFGSAVHEAVAAFYKQHLLGESLRPDQMLDVYRQAWNSRNGADVRFFNGDGEESLREKALQLVTVFHQAFDPAVEVLGMEEFFEVRLTESVPPFHGYIDLIELTPQGRTTIVDLKTAGRKLTKAQVKTNLQLTAYSIGAQALGFDSNDLSLRLDVLTKTKNPEMTRYETTRTDQQRERFTRLTKHVWNSIERECWFPRQDWHCQQCAWAETCAKW